MIIKTKTDNRKELVKAVSQFAGEEQSYMGPPSFAYKVGGFTIDRDGVVTSESEEGCEELKTYLREQGYLEQERSDLEISVPIGDMDGDALRNLVFMLKAKQHLLNRVIGRMNFDISDELISALAKAERLDKDEFLALFEASGGSGANKGIVFEGDKVTFTFVLSENGDKNRAYAEVAALMVAQAKEAKRVSPKEQKPENEKYYLRIWLVRLGLAGEAGKASRKALLGGLKGHTAFRTLADEEKHKARLLAKKKEGAAE